MKPQVKITFEVFEAMVEPDGHITLSQAALKSFARVLSRPALATLLAEGILACNAPPEAVAPVPERWLTAAELAEHLGIDKSWVMEAARRGKIPSRKFGRYPRFNLAAVEAALDAMAAEKQCPKMPESVLSSIIERSSWTEKPLVLLPFAHAR